jgi:small-conductance mechanosensitive channel
MGETFIQVIGQHIYTIIIAVVILLIGFIIGIMTRNVLRKILHEIELDRIAKKIGIYFSVEDKISAIVSYLIYFIAIIMFLNQLGLTPYIVYLLVGMVLLLFALTIILGLKDFIPNFVAGMFLYQKKYFTVGKRVRIEGIEGKIKNIGLTEIEIETDNGDLLYVPCSLFRKKKFLIG